MGRHGENIHKRKDGRWEARVICGYRPDGKARYRYLYGRTYQEAKIKRNMLLGSRQFSENLSGGCRDPLKLTFRQVMEECLAERKLSVKESTYANYVNLAEKHLFPELGSCYISSLTEEKLNTFLKEKLQSGRLDGMGGLSAKTVADIRSVLLMGITYAHEQKYPCGVKNKIFYPRTIQPDIRILTKGELEKLETILFYQTDSVKAGILISLYGGLRIGEVCALQWGDISFEEGTLSVQKTIIRIRDLTPDSPKKTKLLMDRPKTVCSVRTIPLPSFILQHIKPLCLEKEKYLLTGTKNFMEPRSYLTKYKKILMEAGMENYTFHTLRHTFATRCVESGFDTKSLSEILGHSNVNTTLQRYVHPSMALKKEQMERLRELSVYSQINSQI